MYVDLAGLAFNAIIAGVVWFLIMPWVRMIQPRATLPFKLAAGAMALTTATEFIGYGLLRFGPGMEIAAYVGFEAARSLLGQEAPDASPVGIVLTAVSIAVMLWLARAKRLTGEALGSRALVADAKQTYACWYLSVVTLAGLALNAAFGWWWADPIAALIIAIGLAAEGVRVAIRHRFG